MTFPVIHSRDADLARSPFRLLEQPMGREVEWVNRFLDREWVRRLAETTLRPGFVPCSAITAASAKSPLPTPTDSGIHSLPIWCAPASACLHSCS